MISPQWLIALVSALVFVLAPGVSQVAAQQIVMKIGDAGPAQIHRHFMAAGSFVFKDYVERLSGGKIKVEVYPENQLGPTKALMEQVKAGVLPAVSTHASVSTLFVPPMELVFMPFAFNSPQEAWKLYDGWFGDKLKKEFVDKLGMLPLYFSDNGGGRSIGTRAKPIRSLADFKGLKIRSPDAVALEKTLASFGAAPSKITWTEVYTSLQTGVVDGTDLGIAVFLYQPFHEVLKYVIVTNHSWDWSSLMVNIKWFKGLPQEYQDIMVMAGRVAETVSRGMSETLAAEAIGQLRKQGIEVYTPTVKEREELSNVARAAVEPLIRKKVGDKMTDDFWKALEEARAEIRKDREKLYGMMGK
jgi:C4-dicarboxylate-binding protein DctP